MFTLLVICFLGSRIKAPFLSHPPTFLSLPLPPFSLPLFFPLSLSYSLPLVTGERGEKAKQAMADKKQATADAQAEAKQERIKKMQSEMPKSTKKKKKKSKKKKKKSSKKAEL
jgi:hypothetical protein